MKKPIKNSDDHSAAITEALAAIGQAQAALVQASHRLELIAGTNPTGPYMDTKTAARVNKLGEVAHRHLEFLESNDHKMTRADSLKIRREMYGDKVRNTANLFGEKGSGALFYRDLEYGTPVHDGDPIKMTTDGLRIAELWRALHLG